MDALSACLKEALKDNPPIVKLGVAHESGTLVALRCWDQAASNLFGAIKKFSRDYNTTDDNENKIVTRKFGNNSQCNHKYETPSGRQLSEYYCLIQLDLNRDVVAALGGAL
jgi:hypothetical protein